MLKFGKRKISKQGGSFRIALPMLWIKSVNPEMKIVTIELESENILRIVAGVTHQDTAGINDIEVISS